MENIVPRSRIATLVNTYLNHQYGETIIGWYAVDEPSSIDNYEPFRIVDYIIDSVSLANYYPFRLHTGIASGWNGKFGSINNGLGKGTHLLYRIDEFWLRAKPKNLQMNLYNYNYPWKAGEIPEWREANIAYVTDLNLDRINNYDTSFAFSTQSGKYNAFVGSIIPSSAQINYHVNLGLMYGAKELRLDPFFSSDNGEVSGLIDENEEETENYYFFKNTLIPRLNGSLGKELRKIHQVEQFPKQQLPIMQPVNSLYSWVQKIEYYQGDGIPQPDFVDIGFFETYYGSGDVPYFMVVNRWYNTANPGELLKISIDKTGTGYINYNVTNFIENTKQTIVNSGYVTMPHISGEARLFKVYPVLKDGGSLVVSETIHPNDILLGDMSIENGATLTINGTYNAKANITVKTGGKIVAGQNAVINFDSGKQLTVEGITEIKGTSTQIN